LLCSLGRLGRGVALSVGWGGGGGVSGGHCFSLCEILHSCEFQETSSDMCKGKTEIFCKFFVGNIGLL